ncbi:hypothetical protein [Salinicola sp. DM10]|uniref:hypothetical protein n=1 Tax=Salinicola sp. DM10 TaxID=2815721 RepID=UPI001E608D54|nr:hypothetical protein [Salinicola sp. DM10]MCE3025747.1 hypothetical protein [Salinicola sp. DM10]
MFRILSSIFHFVLALFDTFKKLPEDKQEKILEAVTEAFGAIFAALYRVNKKSDARQDPPKENVYEAP